MRWAPFVPLFVLAISPLAAPLPAGAYACAKPPIRAWPRGEGAPTNAIVRVEIPDAQVLLRRLGAQNAVEAERSVDATTLNVEVRGPSGAVASMAVRALPATTLRTLVLTPSRPLDARTLYQIVANDRGELFPLGAFTTGDGLDTTPPQAASILRASYVVRANAGYKETRGPFARVSLKEARDAGGGRFFYEVHQLGADGKADDSTLRAIVEDRAGTAIFGRESLCEPSTFVFPEKEKQLRVGLRPVDMAGNRGPLLETVLDLAHPQPR